jgi:hypothetical protein
MHTPRRGSTILVVLIATVITGIAATSVMSLIKTERRIALRKELEMQAINASECALDYAYSVLINQIETAGNFGVSSIPTSGSSALSLPSDAISFLNGAVTLPTGAYSGRTGSITFSGAEVRVQPSIATLERFWIDPADPANQDDPNRGQWVWERYVPIVARVTATQGADSYTAYVQKSIVSRRIPMFQHAIFFQGQLQLHRSFRIVGPVHTNGTVLLNAQSGDTSVYSGSITSTGRFYRGSSNDSGGTGINPFGLTPVNANGDLDFTTSVSPTVNLAATGSDRISLYVETQGSTIKTEFLNPGFDSRTANWSTESLRKYKGNLQDKSHQVPEYIPQGSFGYRQDIPTTSGVNEFSNGTYSLIEPLLPFGHAARKSDTARAAKIAARASLILRVERSTAFVAKNSAGVALSPAPSYANEWQAANRGERFIVKAYKYATPPSAGVEPVLSPVRLPDYLIGQANANATAVIPGKPFQEPYTTTAGTTPAVDNIVVVTGLHNPRLGRPVEPFTLDMARLKAVIERTATDTTANEFYSDFPTSAWNGVIYIEMPTSITPNTAALTDTTKTAGLIGAAAGSKPFLYGNAELRHPDRTAETDNFGRPNRTDSIVPFAPELRKYPASGVLTSSSYIATIRSPEFAIPALQIINAGSLPRTTTAGGFTLGTNLPIYTIGAYNCDGDTASNTFLNSMAPNAYAKPDAGEIPAAIFCDTLTVLSAGWATTTAGTPAGTNRSRSFRGTTGTSNSNLALAAGAPSRPATARLEFAACIATGEYPVFEFFTNALESWTTFYQSGVPIVFKGSMIGMFKSEVQTIKQAYGRNVSYQVEDYWNEHGAHAIPSVRFHDELVKGNFPPGIPNAIIFRQGNHRFLRPGNAADAALIAAAGF